jgi:hypothetical protein
MPLLPVRTLASTAQNHLDDHNQIHPKLNDVPNVKRDYGATGDGTTNDVAAFQAAYDALPSTAGVNAVVGGMIFIPPGRYNIGTPGIDMTSGKACYWLGSNYSSTNISANQTACQLRTATGATWPIMQLGPITASSNWWGSVIENISFRDGGGNNTAGAILQGQGNFARIVKCDFQNFQAGYGIKQAASSFDPQYTLIQACTFYDNKFGIYQFNDGTGGTADRASDTEIQNCVITANAAVIAGSVGIRAINSTRIYGGAIQNQETALDIIGEANKVIGTAFENTLTGGLLGINVGTAALNNFIIAPDFAGTYTTNRIRIQAGASKTLLIISDLTGLTDSGTNTIHGSA